ncbi:hypothetical protein [Azospirillum sp. SYSU D00513]|uniref:hypothetical protein n=1 Tax=Azospirillum sp. SYSU D00513 TaxID=2812561 RepID=UPI001A977F2A|nr:hypothetical protein [Azospirillum sp. SYSU D00513]
MAQILSFPDAALPQDRRQALRTVVRGRMDAMRPNEALAPEEGLAEFERMMAHESELRRRADEFKQLCEQAMAATVERSRGQSVVDFNARRVLAHA